MPNPNGVNQFDRFATEVPYGEKKRQGDLERLAPTPAINAPDRAHDQAKRGRPQQPAAAPVQTMPPPSTPQPALVVAEFWRELAGELDDPLIAEYAAEFPG